MKYKLNCRICSWPLRVVPKGDDDNFLVCDTCERATLAPASMKDFLTEVLKKGQPHLHLVN